MIAAKPGALPLPLEDIRRCFDDPAFNQRQALLSQQQLRARADRTADMLRAVEHALELLDSKSMEKKT